MIRYAAPESSTGGAEMWKPEHRRAAERRGLRDPPLRGRSGTGAFHDCGLPRNLGEGLNYYSAGDCLFY